MLFTVLPFLMFAQKTKTVMFISAEGGAIFSEFEHQKAQRKGYVAGLHVEFPSWKNCTIAFGMLVRNFGEQLSYKESHQVITPPNVKAYRKTYYRYRYLGLPVGIKYSIRFLQFFGGVQPNLFLQQFEQNVTPYSLLISENIPDVRPVNEVRMMNVSAYGGMAIYYSLGSNFRIALQGKGDVFFQPIFKTYSDKKFRFSVMPSLVVSYIFKQKESRQQYFPHEPGRNYFEQ